MLGVGASERPSQTVERDVAEDRFTARASGEVQTRPATSRPEIEEPRARPETQQVGEQVSLSHRRVAVDPPVGTDDGPFDLAHHIGPVLGVAITELLARVVFLTRRGRSPPGGHVARRARNAKPYTSYARALGSPAAPANVSTASPMPTSTNPAS